MIAIVSLRDYASKSATGIIVNLSERLGHSGIQITAGTYSHITPEMQQDAIGGVDTALLG